MTLVSEWKTSCGDPFSGWVFSRPGDRPINDLEQQIRLLTTVEKITVLSAVDNN